MKLKHFDKTGEYTSEKEVSIPEFEGSKGLQALKQVLVGYMANKRQGTSSVKTRSTVSGTGKKPFRQKGSGTARQGSKVGPQHYHGSVAHGPHPRDWNQRLNKKMKVLALSRAIYDRASDGEVVVISEWEIAQPKTRLLNDIVSKVTPVGKVLLIDVGWTINSLFAARNIDRITTIEASDLNAHDVTRFDQLILSENGLNTVLQRLNGVN